MCDEQYLLEMRKISKAFPGVQALDSVDLNVKKGVVHAVMGENGAGKSTLMKILAGIYPMDAGEIIFKGRKVHFTTPHDSLSAGISMIHQELSNVLDLTVAENIFLGKERKHFGNFMIDKRKMIAETKRMFDRVGLHIHPATRMKELSIAQQQMCEIVKAISYQSDLIIMDEPTSAITESEVEQLFSIIKAVVAQGTTVIYITHKISEVFQITDYITVYRDAKYIATYKTKDLSQDKLIERMVGRSITTLFPKESVPIGDTVLKIENLCRENEFENISFELRQREILGVSGLMGAGRSELMETVFGIRKPKSGRIFIKGKEVSIQSPKQAIAYKLGFLTEDRKESGCFLRLSVGLNIYVASLSNFSKGVFANTRRAVKEAQKYREALNIKTPSLEQTMESLSGGNQQKALLARWLLRQSDILIVDEPTRGIDVGAKSDIYRLMVSFVKEGKSIIMISSEMPEILGMSDRILVMCEGKLMATLDARDASQELLLQYAAGIGAE